jgi:hypothetical protein
MVDHGGEEEEFTSFSAPRIRLLSTFLVWFSRLDAMALQNPTLRRQREKAT